jgi:drug/metabolite transporter (DMT)-like permease
MKQSSATLTWGSVRHSASWLASPTRTGFVLAFAANLIWGTSFLASKYTLGAWGPFTASALRFAIAMVGMVFLFPALGFSIQVPRTWSSWKGVLIVGLTGFGLLYPLQLTGLTHIPSSLSASIMLTSPLFVLLLNFFWMKETLSNYKILAIIIGMLGGVLLISPANLAGQAWSSEALSQLLTGSLLTIGASLSLAISVIATRSALKELNSASLTFWSMTVGVVLLLPFALLEHPASSSEISSSTALTALVFLALVCSVLAFMMWNRAIGLTSPQHLASTMHVKTPVAVVLGVLVAGEHLTATIVLGTAMIAFAVWLSQRSGAKT